MFIHCLKLIVEAALWDIFNIATMVTLLLSPLVQ